MKGSGSARVALTMAFSARVAVTMAFSASVAVTMAYRVRVVLKTWGPQAHARVEL